MKWLAVVALAAPAVQSLLMGMIGYPIARRRPGGMAAFHRSGFTWWLIALAGLIVVGLVVSPSLLRAGAPSRHDVTLARIVVTVLAAVLVVVLVEVVAEVAARRAARSSGAPDRYQEALPTWARAPWSESALLSVLAVVEEAVYRGIALGGLLLAWDLSKPVASGLVAVAFGVAHWYYGFRQVLIKMVVGSVLVSAALSSGWVVAAVCHVAVNLILLAANRWTTQRSGSGPAAPADAGPSTGRR